MRRPRLRRHEWRNQVLLVRSRGAPTAQYSRSCLWLASLGPTRRASRACCERWRTSTLQMPRSLPSTPTAFRKVDNRSCSNAIVAASNLGRRCGPSEKCWRRSRDATRYSFRLQARLARKTSTHCSAGLGRTSDSARPIAGGFVQHGGHPAHGKRHDFVVTAAAETLLEQALTLPVEGRALLASGLLASLDSDSVDDVGVDRLWSVETDRRATLLDSGEAGLVTWDHLVARTDERRA